MLSSDKEEKDVSVRRKKVEEISGEARQSNIK